MSVVLVTHVSVERHRRHAELGLASCGSSSARSRSCAATAGPPRRSGPARSCRGAPVAPRTAVASVTVCSFPRTAAIRRNDKPNLLQYTYRPRRLKYKYASKGEDREPHGRRRRGDRRDADRGAPGRDRAHPVRRHHGRRLLRRLRGVRARWHGRSASKAWPIPMAAPARSTNRPHTSSRSPFTMCTCGTIEHAAARYRGGRGNRSGVGRTDPAWWWWFVLAEPPPPAGP